jgi:dUTP pyrophosphatase
LIELPVRRLREDATLPAQAYAGDAGFDLAACGRHEVRPGERAVIPTGVAVEIPEGYGGFVLPRSGLAARNGITLLNAPGLIDSGYRGEVKVVFHNADPAETFVVEPGMRIAQLVLLPVPEVRVVEHDQLAASERGERGFGSSRA